MERKFIIASRVILGIFLLCIVIITVLAINTKEINIGIIGVPFMISGILSIISIFSLFIMEMISKYEEQGIRAFISVSIIKISN